MKPDVLAGPILRRVDQKSVTIWLVTDIPVRIVARIYHASTGSVLQSKTKTRSIRAGQKLYLHLVQVPGNFPLDTILGYQLFFRCYGKIYNLKSLGLISANPNTSIAYGSFSTPTFTIPSGRTPNFLYASCRKFHGKGEDTLVAGDLRLKETYLIPVKRPSALFLTGDQIYADDVADPLFPLIRKIAKRYIGEENIEGVDRRIGKDPFRQSLGQVNGRQFLMEHLGRFTSASAANHLMTFGEYASMYLLSWSPALWESDQFPSFEEVLRADGLYTAFPNDERHSRLYQKEVKQLRKRYERQLKDLEKVVQNLASIRRLLANIPTYMIFDDHDVTDDWNLSAEWKASVSRSPLGRNVIANGLSAYWAFQGWGNDPDRFDEEFVVSMEKHFKLNFTGTIDSSDWMRRLFRFRHWHFIAPTQPSTLFLDTRTMRGFDDQPSAVKIGWMMKENVLPPRLIRTDGWRLIAQTLFASGWRRGDPLIVVSPTPLYGLGLIESVLHRFVYPLRTIGLRVHEVLDFEAWKYNGRGFSEFLHHLADWRPSQTVIISGDVHYASSVSTTVSFRHGAKLDILQVTSSPSKNMSFNGIWGWLMKAVIWFNANNRLGQKINRYCHVDYSIVKESSRHSCPEGVEWNEVLEYIPIESRKIVETRNNIGQLMIQKGKVVHSLLMMKALKLKEVVFDSKQ